MAGYRAPLGEIRFWLYLFADSRSESAEPDLTFGDEIADAVLEEAARLAEQVLDPLYRFADQHGAALSNGQVSLPGEIKAAYAQFAEAGWVGLPVDPEYGGQGLPQRLAVAVNEIWKSANLAFSLCPMLTQGAIEALQAHGSQALRDRFLSKMAAGVWTGTMNLTEPQAGSDLGALRTTAIREGEHYRIKGRKIFISWGDHDLAENIIHLVLARTPDAPAGVQGISMFVVPKFLVADDGSITDRNEVVTVSLEDKLGIHGSPTCVLSYGDERGAIGYLVGEENKGLHYMFTMMNSARLAVGVEGLALSERAYQQALAYALDRMQGTVQPAEGVVPIIEHADVRRMLLLMKTGTDAMRGLAYAAAAEIDRARASGAEGAAADTRVSLLTPIVKGWCTEIAQEVASLGIQVHGGVGYIEETGAAQILRDARITTIYEGTTGIQANDLVGRKILRDDGAAMRALLAQVDATVSDLEQHGAALGASARALREGVGRAREIVAALISRCDAEPRFAGAVAVNVLMLLGTLLGGWQLARAALRSGNRADGSAADPSWVDAKCKTSEFYAEQFMPRIEAYRATVMAGSETLMSFDLNQLAR